MSNNLPNDGQFDNLGSASQNSGSSDWDNWDMPSTENSSNNQSNVNSDDFSNDWDMPSQGNQSSSQDDDWDNWGSASESSNSSGSQNDWDNWDNDFDNEVAQENTSNQSSGQFLNQGSQNDFDDFQSQETFTNPVQETPAVNVNKKMAALIIAGVFIVLALVFLFFDGLKVTKNDTSQQQVQQNQQQTQQQQAHQSQQQAQQSQQSQQSNNTSSNDVIVEVPNSVSLNYSGDVLEANGTVTQKIKMVQGNQLIYKIVISSNINGQTQSINYYCTYSSYNAVSKGDLVIITYQQVNDGYISINSITK